MTYQVKFSHVSEIRMGSPFNGAEVHVSGGYFPKAAEVALRSSFQDKVAISQDGTICFLVKWDSPGNIPGFRVVKLSEEKKTVTQSERISGCCVDIVCLPGDKGVEVKVWEHERSDRTEHVMQFPYHIA